MVAKTITLCVVALPSVIYPKSVSIFPLELITILNSATFLLDMVLDWPVRGVSTRDTIRFILMNSILTKMKPESEKRNFCEPIRKELGSNPNDGEI